MLNSKMEIALNQQANAELWAAYLYLSVSYDMDGKGYEGISSWFAQQAKEEFAHATRIFKFIGEVEGKVTLLPIEGVKQEWNSPKEAFEDALKQEKLVTKSIHNLMDMAVETKDYATQNMLKWFVDEQIEEEEAARKILDKFKKVESCSFGLYKLDKELGKRGNS